MLLPQAGEHYGLEGVKRADDGKAGDVLGVGCIAQRIRNPAKEGEHQRHEAQPHRSDHPQRAAVNHLFILVLAARKAEKGGLHSEGQQGEYQSGIGVEIGDYAVASAFRGDAVGVERYQQIVQETPDYAAQAVYGGIFC